MRIYFLETNHNIYETWAQEKQVKFSTISIVMDSNKQT